MQNTLRPAQTLTHSLLVAAALAVTFGTSRTAWAEELCGDVECPKGYTCETSTAGCPDIACVEGEDCKPCEPTEYHSCVPAACDSDDDCGAHMKCAAMERTECSGEAPPEPCEPGTNCEAVTTEEQASCATTTVHQCQPQWTLPCEADADCGEGFTCKEIERCWCSDSGGTATDSSNGTASSSGGAASTDVPEPAEDRDLDATVSDGNDVDVDDIAVPSDRGEDCGCEPTGTFACEPIETACTVDSDCPADWTCEDNPMGYCWADTEGNSGCTPADPAKICQPPYFRLGSGGYAQDLVEDGVGSKNGGDPVPVDDRADATSTDHAAEGEANPGEAPKAADFGADNDGKDAEAEETAANADDSAEGSSVAGGGCSVSAGSGPVGPFGLLLAGALAVLGLRRRSVR